MNLSLGARKGIMLGAEPRANLLPPEVRQADQARTVRRILAMLAILTVVLVGGGYAASAFRAAQAQSGLETAQARTAELNREKLSYAEATSLSNLVRTVTAARQVTVSKEVMWNSYYDAIANFLPRGVVIASGSMLSQLPWQAPMAAAGPLRVPGVATISLVLASPNVIDATAVVRRLVELGAFADASPDSVTATSGGGYTMNVTLNLTSAALSGRFATATAEVSQ